MKLCTLMAWIAGLALVIGPRVACCCEAEQVAGVARAMIDVGMGDCGSGCCNGCGEGSGRADEPTGCVVCACPELDRSAMPDRQAPVLDAGNVVGVVIAATDGCGAWWSGHELGRWGVVRGVGPPPRWSLSRSCVLNL